MFRGSLLRAYRSAVAATSTSHVVPTVVPSLRGVSRGCVLCRALSGSAVPDAASTSAVDGARSEEKATYKQRLRTYMKEYGAAGVAIYATISCGDLALLYVAARAGLDIPSIMDSVGLTWLTASDDAAKASETLGPFVVAYGAHKLLMPARFALAFAVTPPIVRHLRAKGIVKARPTATDEPQEASPESPATTPGEAAAPDAARFATPTAAAAARLRKELRGISY